MKQSCCGFFSGVLLGILVLVVWFLSSVAITEEVLPIQSEGVGILKDIVTTGIGAVVGAGAAFLWNKVDKEKDAEFIRVALINKANLELGVQINTIALILKNVEKAEAESKLPRAFAACYLLPPEKYAESNLVAVGELVEALPDEIHFLLKLQVSQQGYQQTIQSLKDRNDCYMDEYISRQNRGERIPDSVRKDLIGHYSIIKENLYGDGDKHKSLLEDLLSNSKELYKLGKYKYPSAEIFFIEEIPPPKEGANKS